VLVSRSDSLRSKGRTERVAYTAKELAAMTGLPEKTILSWAAIGTLPSYRVGGRRLFPPEAKRILAGRTDNAQVVQLKEAG
jgi:excisionase family DNA binding protein